MPNNKESLSLWDKIKNSFQEGIKKLTSNNLGENLNAKTITVKPSKEQENLLKEHGTICDAIGSKLIVVRNDDGCMLFRLTEENGIEQIDFGNTEFKAKNISRLFKELFVVKKGEHEYELIKFNPDSDTRGKSLGFYKDCESGWKHPIHRRIPGVKLLTEDDKPDFKYADKCGGDIPNFKLLTHNNKEESEENNKKESGENFDGGFTDEC